VSLAQAEVANLRTLWRLHYSMPINDPRFLAATDEEVLEDMLILHFAQEQARATQDPATRMRQQIRKMGGVGEAGRYLDQLREKIAAAEAERTAKGLPAPVTAMNQRRPMGRVTKRPVKP